MMGISIGHILVVGVIVLLFGSRRIPELASAMGKSIKAFKDGINEGPDQAQLPKAETVAKMEER